MEISTLSKKILRDLCTDSRVTITELSSRYGITRKMAKGRVAALEKELGLRYTLELDYEKLGFAPMHVVRVKFSTKPKPAELAKLIAGSRPIQFAATTKGNFDMLVFMLAKGPKEYFTWEMDFWALLAKYGVGTRSAETTVMHLGFVPMNDESIAASSTSDIYKRMLTALNSNSRMTVRELAGKVGISEELAKYHIKKLNRTGIIKRYTAIVTKSPLKYNIVYFFNYTIRGGIASRVQNERRTMYFREPKEFPVLNEFQMMLSTTGSDVSFTWAVYEDYKEGLEQSVMTHARVYRADSPVPKYATIDTAVKGFMPLRNLDQKSNYDLTIGGLSEA